MNKTKDWALVQNAALADEKKCFKVLKNKSIIGLILASVVVYSPTGPQG